MGACAGRTQGASIAALSGRPRTPQRACPARSGSPCSFCWSFLGPAHGGHTRARQAACMTTTTIITVNALLSVLVLGAVGMLVRLAHRLPETAPHHDEH